MATLVEGNRKSLFSMATNQGVEKSAIPIQNCSTYPCYVHYPKRYARRHQVRFFEFLVLHGMGLNPVLLNNW